MFRFLASFFTRQNTPCNTRPFGPCLESLEARDCPTVYTIDHPAAGTSYSLVSGSLFGPGGPSYRDVQQGETGDCWLLSSLAAVAARSPATITNMFTYVGPATENGAQVGLYDVRLYDTAGTPHEILVDTELPAGGQVDDHPANGVLWAALAEKAYAQANGAGLVNSSNPRVDSYAALDSGYGSWAIHAITGQRASDYSFNSSNIAAAWQAGEYVVIGTPVQPSSSYIVGDHDYALVGYNPSSSMPFTVYNPWGSNSSGWVTGNGHTYYGLFTANAQFLSNNYTSESYGYAADTTTGVALAPPSNTTLTSGPVSSFGEAPAQQQPSLHVEMTVQLAPPAQSVTTATASPTPVQLAQVASYGDEIVMGVWVDGPAATIAL